MLFTCLFVSSLNCAEFSAAERLRGGFCYPVSVSGAQELLWSRVRRCSLALGGAAAVGGSLKYAFQPGSEPSH